ncbi:MAG TPA: glycosyltransferase family 2 protein [Micromonosporaceae bacterium]|jgi:glycosyltransferase involved in cell wall biosynthesis|nr:glycosyltransferase family 2 protein [Micromonosporaceae bacterium]
MSSSDVLISVCLPVRNGASTVPAVVESILAQDHANLELVISDNASTDDTEEVCRKLVAADDRIVYVRQPHNIGLLNNFRAAMRQASGTYARWIGDDDWLSPECLSRCVEEFRRDDRLILVTMGMDYVGDDGVTRSAEYHGTALRSDDPIDRFAEMLRLLNESYLLIDPLYGLMRRDAIVDLPRRNMLCEDQVFATKLAIAGPWSHVPQVLGRRGWRTESASTLTRRLGVPAWTAKAAFTLQGIEMRRWVDQAGLDPDQRRRAKAAVNRWYVRRQRVKIVRRSRRVARMVGLAHPR